MFELKPDPSLGHSNFPEDHRAFFDESETVTALADSLGIPEKGMKTLRVNTGAFTINAHINTLVKGQRLYVIFHGARKANKGDERACFVRHNWNALYNGPILSVSDPQTEEDWGTAVPRSGMYIGTFKDDLVPELNALIDKVCDELGIDRGQVVMYGSSAGGTAALLTGARREAGCGVIAVCPGLRPDKFREQMVQAAAAAAGGTLADWERHKNEQPHRMQPLSAMRYGINAGYNVKFVIAQALEDTNGVNRHYKGLWQRFDINPDGGIDSTGHVMALPYSSEDGHGKEPNDLCRPLLKISEEFFDGKLTAAAAKTGKAKK